ncbi:MAG TPA: heme biosynthesis HemY N-terminal domain-containing protein [Methylocella sp.]|nr:heme biosynthesis HemY N-terminal domain-containing protein [Methylocella sp.]
MFRVPLLILVLIALAFGVAWLVDQPGKIMLDWQGYQIETSILVGLGVMLIVVATLILIWNLVRFVFGLPPALSVASRARRRERGYAALSRGLIAVGTGDTGTALKAAAEAQNYLPGEPLALLLKAEASQLVGDVRAVEAAFKEMTQRKDMRLLGFRGLHAHAHRHGDLDAAHHFASAAHELTALPWTAAAVLEKHVAAKDWQGALAALDTSGNLINRPTKDRQRAILTTAIALEKEQSEPDEALRLSRQVLKRAPDLVPAVALAARLLSRQGASRKAAKWIEAAWPLAPHPDLARIYLDLRPGESNADRLVRARTLARLAPRDPESHMTLASAALAACDYKTARETMLPLIQANERPTVRMCLIMAELEEAEHGESGFARDWLARATRAPRDATWVAGTVTSEQWLPAVPETGRLDAFVWRRPDQRLASVAEAEEAIFRPISAPAETPVLIEKPRMAIPGPEPERQIDPAPGNAAGIPQDAARERATTEPLDAENESSRPTPLTSMTPPEYSEERPKPQGLSRLL